MPIKGVSNLAYQWILRAAEFLYLICAVSPLRPSVLLHPHVILSTVLVIDPRVVRWIVPDAINLKNRKMVNIVWYISHIISGLY